MCYPSEEMICEKEETAMKKTAAVLLSMLLVMGFTAVCSAERVDAPVKTGTEGENFVSLWSGDGGDVQVRRAGDRFDVEIELYDCGVESIRYRYSCIYNREKGTLEDPGTGIKTVQVYDEKTDEETVRTEYQDGSAVFWIENDAVLYWEEQKEGTGNILSFRKMGNYHGEWSCDGMIAGFYASGGIYHCMIIDTENEKAWIYYCEYDPLSGQAVSDSTGSMEKAVRGQSDEWERVYDDGAAVFSILEDGRLTWMDLKEDAGKGLLFVREP